MESVDSFIQSSLFADIFTPVATAADGSKARKRNAKGLHLPPDLPEYKVIRSTRRKRSISAYRQNGVIEIHIPARLSRKDEFALIPEMIKNVLAREAKEVRGDDDLYAIAGEILRELLPDFHELPKALSWRVMRERWGSCTTVDATIRISTRLIGAPDYALRYVLFHELIHLRIPDHGPLFQDFLERYPEKARAEAYLEGFEAGLACPKELN